MVQPDAWIAVYIMASARNGTLYTGVTSQLPGRVHADLRPSPLSEI
jgi:predicted GIY-YIG superfamily endonuclease